MYNICSLAGTKLHTVSSKYVSHDITAHVLDHGVYLSAMVASCRLTLSSFSKGVEPV